MECAIKKYFFLGAVLGTALLGVLSAGPLLLVADETEFFVAKCPTNYPKDKIATIAHESDCTKYYACLGNEKHLSECPILGDKRHFFNPKLGVCDWPANVDCQQPRLAVSRRREILPVPTECPKKESMNFTVHLAHESDCTKFYQCSYGKKYLKDCSCTDDGSRLYFDKYLQVCNWPFEVDCVSKDDSTETPCPPPDGPSSPGPGTSTPRTNSSTDPGSNPGPNPGPLGCKGKCPNDDPPNRITPLPHEDCRRWCRCQNREAKVYTCPGNLYFCPDFNNCTTPEKSGCK